MNRLFLLLFGVLTFVANAQIADYVPTDGLVGWYPLDGDAQDLSTLSNEGSVHGATPAMDRHGNENGALNFDVDDWGWGNGGNWVYIPFHEAFNSSEVTVCAWVQRMSDGAANSPQSLGIAHRFQYGYNSPNGEAWRFHILHGEDGSHLFSQIIEQSPSPASYLGLATDTALAEGTWSHVAMTWDDETLKVFLNGQLVGSVNDAETEMNTIGNSGVSLGMSVQANGHWGPLDGNLDEFGMWNRALSESEVLALYNAEAPVPGCTDPTACNFEAEATSDDGSCIPSGCLEPLACNFNALAGCEGEACDFTCCPGPGCCAEGTSWDYDLGQCIPNEISSSTCPHDLDFDGVVGVGDIIDLLTMFGTDCPTNFTCGDPFPYQGYAYATVQIGEQCWFAENLQAEKYRDGSDIPKVENLEDWFVGSGVQCAFDFNDEIATERGLLYNGHVVNDERQLCPTGWHVPSDADFMDLESFIGMSETDVHSFNWRGTNEGTKLRTSSPLFGNYVGTDEFGFNAIPAGVIFADFAGLNYSLHLWSSTSSSQSTNLYRAIDVSPGGIFRASHTVSDGHSVRCLLD